MNNQQHRQTGIWIFTFHRFYWIWSQTLKTNISQMRLRLLLENLEKKVTRKLSLSIKMQLLENSGWDGNCHPHHQHTIYSWGSLPFHQWLSSAFRCRVFIVLSYMWYTTLTWEQKGLLTNAWWTQHGQTACYMTNFPKGRNCFQINIILFIYVNFTSSLKVLVSSCFNTRLSREKLR